MPLLAPELNGQVDEAKSRSNAFQEQQPGPTSSPDEFLATAANSIKNTGKQEKSAFGVEQGTPSDFGVNTTKATDKNAPAPSMNAKNKSEGDKEPEPYELDWRFDQLEKNREKHLDRVDKYEAMDNRNPLEDHELRHSQTHEKRADRREEARQGMADSGWELTDFKNYDTKAHGGKHFNKHDAKWLQSQMEASGMSEKKADKLLGKYIDHFSDEANGKLGQSITMNKDYADYGSGEHYVGDMEEGSKVSDFDWGKKMSGDEVRYLRDQGFSKDDIYENMRSFVAYGNDDLDEDAKKYGIRAHRFMGKQGLYDDWGKGEGDQDPGNGGGDDGGGGGGGDDGGSGGGGGGDDGGSGGGGGDDGGSGGGGGGGGGVPDSPMSPSYNGSYNVQGNPYNASNPGYYYGTDQQAIDTGRYNMISDNAAKAHANGLADIETWQEHAHSRQNYYDNIMHELYSSMGLTGFTNNGGND